MIKHGGNLIEIAGRYQSDISQWIDLSTGVSPYPYPIGEIPSSVWNQLPQDNDGLTKVAQQYYQGKEQPLAVAGSQAAIMLLPEVISEQLGRCGRIALPKVGYKEHQRAWESYRRDSQSWQIEYYDELPSLDVVARCDALLIINPNNPTAKVNSKADLQRLLQQVKQAHCMMIVDEAFADCLLNISLLDPDAHDHNLIVLRSVGKFFGLAGARVGFVFASQRIKQALQEKLGPWTLTGPSRYIVKKALADNAWQEKMRTRLRSQSLQLQKLLSQFLPCAQGATDLFVTVYLSEPVACFEFLCQERVLTRLCDEKNALRIGLPANESQWQHLTNSLEKLSREMTYVQ